MRPAETRSEFWRPGESPAGGAWPTLRTTNALAAGFEVWYSKRMAESTLYDRLELSLPGPWIDHSDRAYAWTVRLLLSSAVDQFNDALVACQFFKPFTADDLKRDASGEVLAWRDPVRDRLRGLYARAYVYALDATRNFVDVLAEQTGNPPSAIATCGAFLQRFKDIRHIRHSLAHLHERSQAKGYPGKRLAGPILDLGSFMGNRFGVTSGDGRHAEVEISEQLLACFRSALLEIIWSFEWIVIGNVRARRPEGTP